MPIQPLDNTGSNTTTLANISVPATGLQVVAVINNSDAAITYPIIRANANITLTEFQAGDTRASRQGPLIDTAERHSLNAKSYILYGVTNTGAAANLNIGSTDVQTAHGTSAQVGEHVIVRLIGALT